jgi:hypothetical protein
MGATMNLLSGVVVVLLMTARAASAQEPKPVSFLKDVVWAVAVDPTTYAPSVVTWKATRLDWRSSQVFFENGWAERNPRFTVGGGSPGVPVDYAAGNQTILIDALANLQLSVLHNLSERLVEHLLLPRYPKHRKLIRTLGWIERSAVASYWTYRLSAGHFRQWQENERRARELGYR